MIVVVLDSEFGTPDWAVHRTLSGLSGCNQVCLGPVGQAVMWTEPHRAADVVDLFQKLFRQDLLVASLFRNFLLAERIMRSYNCTPVSSPKLPPTYQHPMWSVVFVFVCRHDKIGRC